MENLNLKVKIVEEFESVNERFYIKKTIDAPNIIEGLKDDIDNMSCRTPVLIDAGTGFGKTTFIYNECIPRAIERNKNVLIISNRIALSLQQKRTIMKITDSPKQKLLTDAGVKDECHFGNVCVITYHKLFSFVGDEKNKEWISNVMYVAFDEAHFFVSDCLFNNSCDALLHIATKTFRHAVRIYLTATSQELIKPLTEVESKNYAIGDYFTRDYIQRTLERHLIHYYFPRNYDRYNLNFFEDNNDLINLINNSNPKEKWLVFVDSKSKGKKLLKEIKDSKYIDADSKDTTTWNEITENECYSCRVLVSTAVLDCGVNINDDAVKNIAIMTIDKTSMLQMLGRKRLSADENVNLYIYNMSEDELERRHNDIKKKLDLIGELEACSSLDAKHKFLSKLWNSYEPYYNKLFHNTSGLPYVSKLAEHKLLLTNKFLKSILDGEQTFKQAVCEWLGKEVPTETSPLEELENFCKNHLGKQLSETQFNELRLLIIKAFESTGHKEPHQDRKENLGTTALNTRLGILDAPYQIIEQNKIWFIIKTEEEVSE